MDIQVVQRVTDILNAFKQERRELRTGELAKELDVQRSTLHRYLNSMANTGLLDRTPEGQFVLGPVLARVGTLALEGDLDPAELARMLEELAVETSLTAVRSVWHDLSPVVIQVQAPPTVTHVSVRSGTRLPVTAAQTLAFLAYSKDPQLYERVMGLLPGGDRRALEEEIELVRQTGVCVGGRVEEGVRALAVPVFDGTESVAMSLALVGTERVVSSDPRSSESLALQAVARRISARLGYNHAEGLIAADTA